MTLKELKQFLDDLDLTSCEGNVIVHTGIETIELDVAITHDGIVVFVYSIEEDEDGE